MCAIFVVLILWQSFCRSRVTISLHAYGYCKFNTVRVSCSYCCCAEAEFCKKSSTAEIALVGGRDAVQGHSRSPTCMLAPIESPYATSY